jgi:hypothetical protein
LAALKELAKKFPAINPPIGKKKGKKFKKILAKKHLSDHSQCDGEIPRKLRRSHSEGSADDWIEMDVIAAQEEAGNEEIFAQGNVEHSQMSLDKCNSENETKKTDEEQADGDSE